MNPDRTRELALALTAVPSITDSDGESGFAFFLKDMLCSWPYFKDKPENLRIIRTVDDERERYALLAFAGQQASTVSAAPCALSDETVHAIKGRPTVILTGHYDVVSVENYGSLEPYAFDPEALAPRLVAALESEAASAIALGERPGDTILRALDDLKTGGFLPGRGLLDMKAGLAAGLAVFEDHAQRCLLAADAAGSHGSLLFLAVPDEEGSSHGMLSAVRALPGLLAEWDLDAIAAINLDAAVDQGDGSAGRAAFLGSVGKLHPFSLFVGRPTHAGAPFDGINPALAAAEFARGLECAGDVFDVPVAGGGSSQPGYPPPPPTILYHRDLRDHYDVTTPATVFVSANVLTRIDGPVQVLDAVSSLALTSMRLAASSLLERAQAHSRTSGQSFCPPDREPRLVPWAELVQLARQADSQAVMVAEAKARREPKRMEAFAVYVAEAVRLAGLEGPAAVVGLAPPYYPRAALDPTRDAALVEAVNSAVSGMAGMGRERVAVYPSFPGISDMSYLYPSDDEDARRVAAGACPFGIDPLPAGFSCPVVNIGPWGREYHQRLERVHAGYAFHTLPLLIARTIEEIFSAPGL
ncbi:MAG: M20/M25/M40 family metallo-hydrolase [Spirochaetia bacterium]|jgi:arginine utilization protein RocB|nr:M20/M25/M40 family metallo-hydrolase [Spirochaetia bacterium]